MIRDFLANRSGSVALMVGTSFLLLTLAAGGAVDYANATAKRHALQDVLDTAVLSAAGMIGASDAERKSAVGSVLAASEVCATITCGEPDSIIVNGKITTSVAADVPTALMQIFTMNSITIEANASATARGGPLKVALVLDYSNSMNASSKHENMRTAAIAFLDRAIAAPTQKVAVGLVPFSEYVMTPISGDYATDATDGTNLDGLDVVGCLMNRGYPHAVSVDTPTIDAATKWPSISHAMGSDPAAGGYSGAAWTDGGDDYDHNYYASPAARCQAYADSNVWVRPLTKTLEPIKTALQSMTPIWDTNIALGLDVGWHLLSDNEPFTESTVDDPEAKKVVILLTDGEQTIRADGPHGNTVASANSNISETCEAMKAADIEIFVIAFAVADAPTRTLLRNCATDEPFYYQPDVTDQLDLIFEGIYDTISGGEARLSG